MSPSWFTSASIPLPSVFHHIELLPSPFLHSLPCHKFTSRILQNCWLSSAPSESLEINSKVSSALVEIVQRITIRPRYILAKVLLFVPWAYIDGKHLGTLLLLLFSFVWGRFIYLNNRKNLIFSLDIFCLFSADSSY